MLFYATLCFFFIYFICYTRAVRKPILYYQDAVPINKIIKSIPALHEYFIPSIIYTKGIFESKLYQFRNKNERKFKRIKIKSKDGLDLFMDVYDVIKKEPNFKKNKIGIYDRIFGKININFYKIFVGINTNKERMLEHENIVSKEEEESKISEQLPFSPFNNVLLIHGFNGSSSVSYIKNLAFILENYRIFALNARGTLSELKSTSFFHIGWTDDLDAAVKYISTKYSGTISLIGFSKGASWITNYLSKHKNERVIGGIGVCVPFDFIALSSALKDSCVSTVMTIEFKKYLERHKIFDNYKYELLNSVEEIDKEITTKVFGFKSIYDYYKNESCVSRLRNINVPILFINTKDDPLIPYDTIPIEEIKKNPALILCILEAGGHLGLMDCFLRKSFLENVVEDFLNALNKK